MGVEESSDILTCINLMQPWADAIVAGRFPLLVRSFPTKIRGTVGITANSGIDGIFLYSLTESELLEAERMLLFDCVIGSIDIVDCVKVPSIEKWNFLRNHLGKAFDLYPTHLVPGGEKAYCWFFKNPARFKKPLPIETKTRIWSKARFNSLSQQPSNLNDTFWTSSRFNGFIETNKRLMNNLSYLRMTPGNEMP